MLDRPCVFYSGAQNEGFHLALQFRQGNWSSLQTAVRWAAVGFVLLSHDIIADGASRGCEPNPL